MLGEKIRKEEVKRTIVYFLVLFPLTFLISYHPEFIKDVSFSGRVFQRWDVPEARYNIFFLSSYFFCFLFPTVVGFRTLRRKIKELHGYKKLEVQYLFLGMIYGISAIVIIHFIFPLLGTSQLAQFSPVGILIMNGFIAYGIVKHHIMEVRIVLKNTFVYASYVFFFSIIFIISIQFFNLILKKKKCIRDATGTQNISATE